MRTTLTIDEDIVRHITKKRLSGRGRSFKHVVNETLRKGIQFDELKEPQPKKKFELKGRILSSKARFNFDKVQQLVENVDNEEGLA